MRVLFLSPRQSWPPISGAKLRDYYFAKALGRRAKLTYAFFAERGADTPTLDQFPFCERLVAVPAPDTYTLAKIVKGIAGRWPLPVLNYISSAMQDAIRQVVSGASFDLVHIDIVQMAGYAPLIAQWMPGARITYNWHNIESELMSRYAETAPSFAHRLYGHYTAMRMRALEKRLLETSFGHLVCSSREKDQLCRIDPRAKIAVIENGVDAKAFHQSNHTHGARTRLVFVGSMNYHANIDAAVWFTREVWPEIHRKFPQWRLALVGSNPVPAVRALAGEAVEVTGTVPSVAPYYDDALAAIVPLRSGAGTRLKILEAMAAGVPVVSTTLGAEGLALSPGEHILIADQEKSWVDALASLAGSSERWNGIASAARNLVESRYDWDVLGESLYETYRDWLQRDWQDGA
jgi:glycosyltransferase involved in cell wall biosynthesis